MATLSTEVADTEGVKNIGRCSDYRSLDIYGSSKLQCLKCEAEARKVGLRKADQS